MVDCYQNNQTQEERYGSDRRMGTGPHHGATESITEKIQTLREDISNIFPE